METWVPIVTAILSLVGVIITSYVSSRNTINSIEQKLSISQAVTDTKLENLTQEVRRQTDFAIKIPVLEQRVTFCENDIKELKSRC